MDSSTRVPFIPAFVRAALLPRPVNGGAPWRIRLLLGIQPAAGSRRLQSRDSALQACRVTASSDPTPGESGILARVAGGDDHAMESCIQAYGPLVWAIVQRRVRDRSAAEDLTQEIFTEVWKNAARHDPSISGEGGFIAMIARRRAIDWVRRQQRLPEIESLPATADFPATSEDPGQGVDRETLWQALGRLPEETRQLFAMHFEQGMTHAEIAEKTGLPLGSVKTRLRRGLIEARSMLHHLDEVAPTSTGRSS
jgi:RNA polymerase sigma-70 factor (ECF subfamily)